jgi:GTPase SAR1 family protein
MSTLQLPFISLDIIVPFFPRFQESGRDVTKDEGMALAKQHGCLFLECSAKTRENVEQCFEELALKVLLKTACSVWQISFHAIITI